MTHISELVQLLVLFFMNLIINSAAVPIIQMGVADYFTGVLSKITLDTYYFILSDHQVQYKIYQLRVMVQSFLTGPIIVSFLIGGYGILEMIFCSKVCSLYYHQ